MASKSSHDKRAIIARQDAGTQCASASTLEDYNLGLHIFAVFLILLCGTLACCFPTIVKAYPRLAISKRALFICRHFGTGVLIALAFAHLLPTAFENLWDDCLPEFWTEGYDAMPGFIAMIAALSVMLIEMIFTFHGFKHTHSASDTEERRADTTGAEARPINQLRSVEPVEDYPSGGQNAGKTHVEIAKNPQNGVGHGISPRPASLTSPHGDDGSRDGEEQPLLRQLSKQQIEKRMILQCLLLEAGILFHSVFIGLSISVSTGTIFIALMVAIAFHQIFEGLALGARIAAIESFKVANPKPWLMSLAYGFTCPLGQIIGLAIRHTYNPEGQSGLLVVGIANAISAGMILYAGLVQLLGEELLSEKSYIEYKLRARVEAVVSVIAGALLMSMIAIWA